MSDSSPPPLDDRLRELLTALVEGTLTDDQQTELEQRVADDPAARDHYIDVLTLHALLLAKGEPASDQLSALRGQLTAEEDPTTDEETARSSLATHEATASGRSLLPHPSPLKPHSSPRNRRNLTFGIVAGFAFLAGLIGWAAMTYLPGIAKNNDKPNVETDGEVIAWLMNTYEVGWKDGGVPESTQYKSGQRLAIEKGLIEIRYATGAEVIIEGPAEFVVGGTEAAGGEEEGNRHQSTRAQKKDREKSVHPSSFSLHPSNSGYLALGRLVARCDSPGSKGFAIETPTTRVVDLGTEFGVEVHRHGKTKVAVLAGKVDVLRAAPGSEPMGRVRLVAGETAAVDPDRNEIARADATYADAVVAMRRQMVRSLSGTKSLNSQVISIDFNRSTSANHSGEPSNTVGLMLPGQVGPWNGLRIATGNSSTAVTIGAVTFTLNSDGDQYEAFGTSPLRDDVAFLNNTTASSISWTLTGLTAGQAYDLILFGQSFNGSPANPADFSITGHDAGNGVGSPVTLDAENDGNFTGVIAVGGTISGTFALRSGQSASAWSGLQFHPVARDESTAMSLGNAMNNRNRDTQLFLGEQQR